MAEYTESWQKLEEVIGARPVLSGTADEMRVAFAGLLGMLATQYPPLTDDVTVENGSLDNGPSYRVYRPRSLPSGAPLAVYFHGGGLVLGDLDSEDRLCRTLSSGAGVVLVSIGYRLAPEHKAPTQVDDSLKGLEWTEKNASTLTGSASSPLLVIGISAGGGLALSVTRRVVLGKSSVPATRLSGLVLLSPVSLHPDNVPAALKGQYTAYTDLATSTAVVDKAAMHTFFEASGVSSADPDAFAALDLPTMGFPPTYVAVCENDPVRDDGNVVDSILESGGISMQRKVYRGLPHCFWIFPTLPETAVFEQDTVAAIRSLSSKQ
ncbi:hypothetical protein Sste5346_004466 [Sporothrix stenoceras]|uniref:Alpha/beta hydrolase fold-3 domain-containing protein n=1 Tax=Sporothrix stenoceras TaxID=5173 RepID=A0ABR3ZAF2_9PEZI